MSVKKIAQVLLCRCSQNKELFGITLEKRADGDWNMAYSYPINENRAKSEGFDSNKITASLYLLNSFKGCPFCGSISFFQCGVCNRISCKKNDDSVNCAWCKTQLTNFLPQDKASIETGAD